MSATRCTHGRTRELGEWGYTGSVAGPHGDENRAAHGCVTVEVECLACGARRRENHNGGHVEFGPWGPDREARQRTLTSARLAVRALVARRPAPITLQHGGADACRVSIDRDGMLLVDGHLRPTDRELALAAPEFVAAARELRLAVKAAEKVDLD